jgi:hypothetical protein
MINIQKFNEILNKYNSSLKNTNIDYIKFLLANLISHDFEIYVYGHTNSNVNHVEIESDQITIFIDFYPDNILIESLGIEKIEYSLNNFKELQIDEIIKFLKQKGEN